MKSLKQQAISVGEYAVTLLNGEKIAITTWTIRFPAWTGIPLSKKRLSGTYVVKPLVKVEEEPVFGELAILRFLQKDGWDGVWVDTFHGEKLFWNGLPDRTLSCSLPTKAQRVYDKIIENHGKFGGFFDVFVWRGSKFLFIEYKGKGDKLNANQIAWIDSAIKSGIPPKSLLLVEFIRRDSKNE